MIRIISILLLSFVQHCYAQTNEGTVTNVVRLEKVVSRLSSDDARVRIQYSWFCIPTTDVRIPEGAPPIALSDLRRIFQETLEGMKYAVEKPSESIFNASPAMPAGLLIGATVQNLQARLCYPFTGSPTLHVGNISRVKGKVSMQIRWEIYSIAQSKVVHISTTSGSYETNDSIEGGSISMFQRAFSDSLRNLATEPSFNEVLSSPLHQRRQQPSPDSEKSLNSANPTIASPKG